MAAARSTSGDGFDERFTRMRDKALQPGEDVVAQQAGDRGQALVLSNSRVMVLKAGLSGTGSLNGENVCAYPHTEIECVRLRRGPMGAVLHIVRDVNAVDTLRPPENMVVFSGDVRVKKCEAIAAKIEAALGKPIERVEFSPDNAASGRATTSAGRDSSEAAAAPAEPMAAKAPDVLEAEPVASEAPRGVERPSLAQEMYTDLLNAGSTAPTEPAVAARPAAASVVFALEQESIPTESDSAGFRPNPRLPRPLRRGSRRPKSAVFLVCGLALVLVAGVAIVGRPPKPAAKSHRAGDTIAAMDRQSLEARLKEVAEYDKQTRTAVSGSTSAANAAMSAIRGNRASALRSAASSSPHDAAFESLRQITIPPGLVGAQELLETALVERKTAITSLSSEMADEGSSAGKDALPGLTGANKLISQAFARVGETREHLRRKLAGITKQAPVSREDAGSNAAKG